MFALAKKIETPIPKYSELMATIINSKEVRCLSGFLLALENLANHWGLINPSHYGHRTKHYPTHLRQAQLYLPSEAHEYSRYFHSKTLVLSSTMPTCHIRDGLSIKINSDYSVASGRLNLMLSEILSIVGRIREDNERYLN